MALTKIRVGLLCFECGDDAKAVLIDDGGQPRRSPTHLAAVRWRSYRFILSNTQTEPGTYQTRTGPVSKCTKLELP
jgi:hypothetical protein